MNKIVLPICVIVQRHSDDQRVKCWIELLSSRATVYLVSGESGDLLHLLPDCDSVARIDRSNSLAFGAFPTKVDFVLLHGGDSGNIGDCWSGAKNQLADFHGTVFLFDSPGTPSEPDQDFNYLCIRRKTKPTFEVTERHVDEILQFVGFAALKPSCCKEKPKFLLAIKLLCECYEMSRLSGLEMERLGIKNFEYLKDAEIWFSDVSNWQCVLQDDFMIDVENELGAKGIYPCLVAILRYSQGSEATKNTARETLVSQSSSGSSDKTFQALVSELKLEVDNELQKHA